jgi:hypothetical protein
MNPQLTDKKMNAMRRLDPQRFAREYLAEFAEDLESFLAIQWIENAVAKGRFELPPDKTKRYSAGVDATGLSESAGADTFTLTICHFENEILVHDVIKGWRKKRGSNIDLESIVAEIGEIVKAYGLRECHADKYARRWPIEAFKKVGITLRETEQPKSEFYLEMVPLFAQGRIEILDHPDLQRELRLLERRPRPGGKILIDHPRGSHDDFANSLAIAAFFAKRATVVEGFPIAVGKVKPGPFHSTIDEPLPSYGELPPEEDRPDKSSQGEHQTFRFYWGWGGG